MDFFYPNPAQTGRKNYIFIGRGGASTYPDTYNTNVVSIASNDRFEIGIGSEQSSQYGVVLGRRASLGFGGDITANLTNILTYVGEDDLAVPLGGGVLTIGTYRLVNGVQSLINVIQFDKADITFQFSDLWINGTQYREVAGAFDATKKYLREV